MDASYIAPSRVHRVIGDQATGHSKWNAMAKQKPLAVAKLERSEWPAGVCITIGLASAALMIVGFYFLFDAIGY